VFYCCDTPLISSASSANAHLYLLYRCHGGGKILLNEFIKFERLIKLLQILRSPPVRAAAKKRAMQNNLFRLNQFNKMSLGNSQ
jgi:hypothetical protein